MGDRNKGLYEKKEGPLEALKEPRSSVLYGDGKLEPYPMPESAILDGSPEAPPEPPPEPPPLPPDPATPPCEMIREDGCGSVFLLVLAAGMLAFMLGLATGCTTSFSTEGEDTWDDTREDADADEDGTDVAESPDLEPDVVEVTEDTEDDGGGDPDAEEEDLDPCLYYPTWYRDMDMDGWGRDDLTVCFPTQPEGYVDRGGDCCDVRPEVHPGVGEWADEPYTCPDESWDYDCDGEITFRWPGSDPGLCDSAPGGCSMFCQDITDEEECLSYVWWPGGAPGCGETDPTYMGWCNWAGGCYLLTGTDYLHQQCR